MDVWFVYMYFLLISLHTVMTVLCNQDCPVHVRFDQPWNRICQVQTEIFCRNPSINGAIPSAPRNLRVVDYAYNPRPEFSTLAMNITWQFPENVTELKGFVVHLMKTSYPVGFQECKNITFAKIHAGSSESNLSMVHFTLSDWHNVDIDGIYKITVTSLDSGQTVDMSYHTKRCSEVPQVNNCLIHRNCSNNGCLGLIPQKEEWRPPKPTVSTKYDLVTVTFRVYPGDFWLDYEVGLFPVTTKVFREVNSRGHSDYFSVDFDNVPPGQYKAWVNIIPGDTFRAFSDAFNVTAFARIATESLATTPVPKEPTSSQTRGTPEEKEAQSGKPISNKLKIVIGAGSGVFAAVVIILGLIIWRWKAKQQSTSIQNNSDCRAEVPFNSGNSFCDNSTYTSYSHDHGIHTVKGINCDHLTDLGSLADESAIGV